MHDIFARVVLAFGLWLVSRAVGWMSPAEASGVRWRLVATLFGDSGGVAPTMPTAFQTDVGVDLDIDRGYIVTHAGERH